MERQHEHHPPGNLQQLAGQVSIKYHKMMRLQYRKVQRKTALKVYINSQQLK